LVFGQRYPHKKGLSISNLNKNEGFMTITQIVENKVLQSATAGSQKAQPDEKNEIFTDTTKLK